MDLRSPQRVSQAGWTAADNAWGRDNQFLIQTVSSTPQAIGVWNTQTHSNPSIDPDFVTDIRVDATSYVPTSATSIVNIAQQSLYARYDFANLLSGSARPATGVTVGAVQKT